MTKSINSTEAIRNIWDTKVEEYTAMVKAPTKRKFAVEIELAAFCVFFPKALL